MSKKENNVFIIEEQDAEVCEYCGNIAELRPYGRNGENICYSCGMKDEETTTAQFLKVIDDVDVVIVKL